MGNLFATHDKAWDFQKCSFSKNETFGPQETTLCYVLCRCRV